MVHDASCERGVLAGIYRYGVDAYLDVSDIITTSSFFLESHQIIFKVFEFCLKDKTEVKLDLPSILSAGEALGLSTVLSQEDNVKILRGIGNLPIEKDNVREFAKTIRRLEITRELMNRLEESKDKLSEVTGYETLSEIIASAESVVSDYIGSLNENKIIGAQSISQGIEEYYDFLLTPKSGPIGISTGMPLYDAAIGGGFRPGTVNLFCARMKVGKTQLVDNIALHVAGKLGIPVLNLDSEMGKEDHWTRMIANLSGITINELESSSFVENPEFIKNVRSAVDKLKSIPYHYLSIAGQDFEETIASIRRWIKKEVGYKEDGKCNPCVVMYDYLKLMSSNAIGKNIQEYQALGFQITSLHNLMVETGASCGAFVQANRDGISNDTTAVIAGSDRLGALASNVTLFKEKTKEEIAEERTLVPSGVTYNRKLIPLVCRHGPGLAPGDYINVSLIGSLALIKEGPTRNELHGDDGELEDDEEDTAF